MKQVKATYTQNFGSFYEKGKEYELTILQDGTGTFSIHTDFGDGYIHYGNIFQFLEDWTNIKN